MTKRKEKNIAKFIRLCYLTGALMAYNTSAFAVMSNDVLPQNGNFTYGMGQINNLPNNVMNIEQSTNNAVIKWDAFSIGSAATVNFKGSDGFNVLNYVDSGNMSQIHGTMNAANGNVYLVNTAGTFIGKSAQINVGSLYVSNKKMESQDFESFLNDSGTPSVNGIVTNAELMSLGHINANNVTFEGNRIVLDMDRLSDLNGDNLVSGTIDIKTNDQEEVILGYTAYDESYGYSHGNANKEFMITADGQETKIKGYMWVEDIKQLQAISSNLNGNYALHNGIDATSTKELSFTSIGTETAAFTGKLDGLASGIEGVEFSIFDLNIEGNDNLGLFGVTENATIKNLIMSSGSVTGTGENIGAVVGKADGGSIKNILSSMNIYGQTNVGGIVGSAGNLNVFSVSNTGHVEGYENVGGLIGKMSEGQLLGNSYNIGKIEGKNNSNLYSHNIGGLIGLAQNAIVGSENDVIKNQLTVNGGYNVGGIVGKAEETSITNAVNTANITANSYIDETYKYHTDNTKMDVVDGCGSVEVCVANVGGIAGKVEGGKLTNITNSGNSVQSVLGDGEFYIAGNVGGIVGSSSGVEIENAINQDSYIYGAHNIGGIAGYFDNGKITNSFNIGGDIMGTGARLYSSNDFAEESIRQDGSESFNIGNIGGIAGYIFGDDAYIAQSGNRGNVHSLYIIDNDNIPEAAKAANVGGIVGKIDRTKTNTLDVIKKGVGEADGADAAVSDSYNTGKIQGYTGVGGIVGQMYNGEVAGSYNVGSVLSTRRSTIDSTEALNMGGIVGDTTEESEARALIYDSYNEGEIGDKEYTKFYGRHVGGVVGRLSGTVEQSYNVGNIYNGFNVVGGIVGYFYTGEINNTFNAGNITVVNQSNASSQVGGIAGAVDLSAGNVNINNSYNLGILRSFKASTGGSNSLGGILGQVVNWKNSQNKLSINNVYTTGNLYTAVLNGDSYVKSDDGLQKIIGDISDKKNGEYEIKCGYYIAPSGSEFFTLADEQATTINFADRYDKTKYEEFNFSMQEEGGVVTDGEWRIYDTTTPILNAFLPNSEGFFRQNYDNTTVTNIQYGTAYNPLLTIITAKDNSELTYDWTEFNSRKNASFAVLNGSLTLNNFDTDGNYYVGTLYSDGKLTINGSNDIKLGRSSKLYGGSVDIDTDGALNINGSIIATGNDKMGNVTVNGQSVDIVGTIDSAQKGEKTVIYGIGCGTNYDQVDYSKVNDTEAMPSIEKLYCYVTSQEAVNDGNVDITSADGNVNILLGVSNTGKITAYGDLAVNSAGSVFIDSDLDLNGNLQVNALGEIVLDISNIGKTTDSSSSESLHNFLKHFANDGTEQHTISFVNDNRAADAIIAIDMWNGDHYDIAKYDDSENNIYNEIADLSIENGGTKQNGWELTSVWISDAEQLKGIQDRKNSNPESPILSYNFALKNDIDASGLEQYNAIGVGDTAFTGSFDGRRYNIIGLNVADSSGYVGVFAHVGENGSVKNLNVISSNFTGGSVGAIAGWNEGSIENVTTFGNRVVSDSFVGNDKITGSSQVGTAGGITGINTGSIINANVNGAVISDIRSEDRDFDSTAGGITGINMGTVKESVSNSAVTASHDSAKALGGVVGINLGETAIIDHVESLGIVNGSYKTVDGVHITENVGGIAGVNFNGAKISNAYNEAYVFGSNSVGGIVGYSGSDNEVQNLISNVINSGIVTSSSEGIEGEENTQNTGGLIGNNNYTDITNARNTGTVTGENYVGGMVGYNAANSKLSNIINDGAASITGENYVGGIAGNNAGDIDADQMTLVNNGDIYGQNYVGGIAGLNEGNIKNTNNDISLYIKDIGKVAEYFGGVTGLNSGSGTIANATNSGNVMVSGASYVGGIAGLNEGKLEGAGNSNSGVVIGNTYVGGVVGLNRSEITGTETEMLVIRNDGLVAAEAGGAGGIFGKNEGVITYVELINSGKIYGTDSEDNVSGTGGLIGENGEGGIVTHSSLKNEVNGQVTGIKNVGGLIGKNYANITGGRDYNNSYYKYQIYNNGVINVGAYKDVNDDGQYMFEAAKGENIGGLFGYNKGYVTAAYNTGAINADQSDSVGGIAGNNSGTLDQVFNTVMTSDGENAVISGDSNVGGLVGCNIGRIENAYNSTAVRGQSDATGYIVGLNKGTIDNVFDVVNDQYNLIGKNEKEDGTTNLYQLNSGDLTEVKLKDRDSYTSLENDKWKFYNGYQTPLLKVFLTKAEYNGSIDFSYNAQDQGLSIESVTAADGMKAYHNVNDLFMVLQNKDAGEYLAFYSDQIALNNSGDEFNPNNLGYDIDVNYKINKASLSIILDDISRVYGNDSISNLGNEHKDDNNWFHYGADNDYGYSVGTNNLTQEMITELQKIVFTQNSDGAVDNLPERKNTNNVGDYVWGAIFDLGELAANYEFIDAGGLSSYTGVGTSTVEKADLVINVNDQVIFQGEKPDYTGTIDGLTNGDNMISDKKNYFGVKDPSIESNLGTHEQVIGVWLSGQYYELNNIPNIGFWSNYNVTIVPGDLTVNKKENDNYTFWEADDKYSWAKKREERERKAELNFISGGMEI